MRVLYRKYLITLLLNTICVKIYNCLLKLNTNYVFSLPPINEDNECCVLYVVFS